MLPILRRLVLGIFLITAASALLLFSDLGSRTTSSAPRKIPRVALLQHASQSVLEEGTQGMIDGLAEAGFEAGTSMQLRRYNAEGDTTVSNAIARDMVNADNDLLLTISTVSLQAVANANQTTRRPHIFALVSNPSITGVGISATDPLDHPSWLAGYGTLQPVAEAFDVARTMNPQLRRVGVVWNASEANSEGQVKLAREFCRQHGIELLEATVDSSAGVGEAAAAVCSRGAEAVFVPGDVMVMVSIDTLIGAANRAGVPVFTVTPPNVRKGTLFDIGADYHRVGLEAGRLAGEILNGRDPASVEIVNFMPESLMINEAVLSRYANRGWRLPDDIRGRSHLLISPDGVEAPGPAAAATPGPVARKRDKPWKLSIILYSESLPAEETLHGLKEGMAKWPLQEGKDFVVRVSNAQGDVAALGSLMDSVVQDKTDIVIPLSTPALQSALQRVKNAPIVFSMVANPMAAGAGASYEDHLPNVTGITVLAPAGKMLDMLQKYFPNYRRIGTLFCPAEANSVYLREVLLEEAEKRGLILESVAVNTPSELADAAMSLAAKPIDAIVQISDNITSSGFTAIAQAARQRHMPLFSLNSTTLPLGAPVVFGRDYHDAGFVTAGVIERVMNGESPARIPFALSPKVVMQASLPNAKAVGMVLPPAFLAEMEKVIEK